MNNAALDKRVSHAERTTFIWQAVSGNPTTSPPGKETFTHYSKYRKNTGREKGERVRKIKSPLNRNFGTIFSLSPNKKAIHDSWCSCKAKWKQIDFHLKSRLPWVVQQPSVLHCLLQKREIAERKKAKKIKQNSKPIIVVEN